MFDKKVAILPCTGVGQVVGTIARQAAYRVCDEKRPSDTVLVCLPALVKGVQEDLDMIQSCPVVLIEGCKERCASHALKSQQGRPSATVFVPKLAMQQGISVENKNRACLAETERALVDIVADEVVAEVDRLKSGGVDD